MPSADVYVIEEQHQQRAAHNMGFLAISINLRCLESMVYALLHQRTGASVHSLLPRQVSGYFDIHSNTSGRKKMKAVTEVKKLIKKESLTPLGGQVIVDQEWIMEEFLSRKKKDDLSDCLLQALTLLDWGHMCRRLESHVQSLRTGDT